MDDLAMTTQSSGNVTAKWNPAEVITHAADRSRRSSLVSRHAISKSGAAAAAACKTGVTLSTVNGDVLHEIVSFLQRRDVLNLSLTAHRVHDFAIHQIGARLVCRTAADLRCLHHHLLQGTPKRAVFLRSLTVVATTFVDRPWQDDPNWIFPETTFEYPLAPLLGDILEAAPGLTHLSLEHVAQLLQHDARIGTAIACMSRIVSLELCQIDSQLLPLFQMLRSRPTHLHISTVKSSTLSEAKLLLSFVYEVLAAIAPIRELCVLDLDLSKISYLPPNNSLEDRSPLIPLPHVRRLSVHWHSQLVDLTSLFPNLDILEQHINSFPFDKNSGPPLRRLSITALRAQGSVHHHPVHLLQLRRYPRDLESFLNTIGETSPVGLALHAFIDTPQWIQYWQQLPQTAPRLKFMDVRCHMWDQSPQPGWVGRFIDSMRGYSLVCIRIVAPQPESGELRWSAEDVQMLAELPEQLMLAIPSLRYIACAVEGDVSDSEYKWYEDEYDCSHAEYKWYQVAEGALGRKLNAISTSDAERVRHFLLDSDLETIMNIDANLIARTAQQ